MNTKKENSVEICQVFILIIVLCSLIFVQGTLKSKVSKTFYLPAVGKCKYMTESVKISSPAQWHN